MKRIVMASGNAGKIREIDAVLGPLGFELVSQSAFNVSEADEPYPTFVENALAKARHAARATGLPALADDSGLCVNALKGAPGVLSARFGGLPKSDARNNQRLIEALTGVADRSAYFYCVLVLVRHADDPAPLVADGAWDGQIVDTPQGAHGFGYDPHFFLPEYNLTAAELDVAAKIRISHRGQALATLLKKLKHLR